MPLRSAPLPRMAGHLSFMRAQTKPIEALGAGDLAVLGVPFEDTSAPHAGQSLAARALRETSVYFGWHANPQFSHPIDIDARQDIQTDGLHEHLCDLGDLSAPTNDRDSLSSLLAVAVKQIADRGACSVILGGSDPLFDAVQASFTAAQRVQLGGRYKEAPARFHIAPLSLGKSTPEAPDLPAQLEAFACWRKDEKPLLVQFDLSAFETSLSGLCDQPRLGGCDLKTVAQWLSTIGQHPVSAIMLTGLNPNRPGMGVVKVGQRLMVTALLAFIYARLGFVMDPQGNPSSKDLALT